MTERLREIEQRCEKADEVVGGSSAGWGAYLQDIPYLLSVIKEQAEEIEELKRLRTSGVVSQGLGPFPRKSNGEHSEDAKPLDGTVQE